MKNRVLHKTTLLVALLFAFCSLSAQNLNYDFEQCNVGDKVAETLGEPWTTWDFSPGSEEDAIISNEHCIGTRALKIDNGNDVILLLGDKTTGVYHISFDMYIPEGKEAYFNLQHVFGNGQQVQAIEAFFNSEENGGTSVTGSYVTTDQIEIPFDEWFNIDITIYIDDIMFNLKINDELVSKYSFYSSTSISDHYTSLAAIDFWPCSSNAERNGFFVDNILFEEVEGSFTHNIVSENETIDVVLQKDEIDTISNLLINEGNAMGVIKSWIDYGVGEDGGEPKELHYDTEPYWQYGYYSTDTYVELGVEFFLYNLNQFIGMKITGMQYFVPVSWQDGSVGCEAPLTFRVYKINGGYNFENELLAEKVLYEFTPNVWNTVVFDDPIALRGFPVFATVGFRQIDGKYPISLDAGPSNQGLGDLVQLNGGGWFSLNRNSIYYGGSDYGNHNIRLLCEGTPVNTQWVRLSKSPNYLVPEEQDMMNIVFNSCGLDYGYYEAVLRIATINDENPEIAIPIKLKVSGADVNEFTENKYKVYPNPATDVLFIEGQNLKHVVIYNTVGEMIKVLQINNNSINIHELENGVYFICIIDSDGAKTVQKVIISK